MQYKCGCCTHSIEANTENCGMVQRLGFGACGTVRLNHSGLPEGIKSHSNMDKGDVQSVIENGLLSG